MLEHATLERQVRVAPALFPLPTPWLQTDHERVDLGGNIGALPAIAPRVEVIPVLGPLRQMLRRVATRWLEQAPRLLRDTLLVDWRRQSGLDVHVSSLDLAAGLLDLASGVSVLDALAYAPRFEPHTVLAQDAEAIREAGATLLYYDALNLVAQLVTGPAGAEVARRRGAGIGDDLGRWQVLSREFRREMGLNALPPWLRRMRTALTLHLRTTTLDTTVTGPVTDWPTVTGEILRFEAVWRPPPPSETR